MHQRQLAGVARPGHPGREGIGRVTVDVHPPGRHALPRRDDVLRVKAGLVASGARVLAHRLSDGLIGKTVPGRMVGWRWLVLTQDNTTSSSHRPSSSQVAAASSKGQPHCASSHALLLKCRQVARLERLVHHHRLRVALRRRRAACVARRAVEAVGAAQAGWCAALRETPTPAPYVLLLLGAMGERGARGSSGAALR